VGSRGDSYDNALAESVIGIGQLSVYPFLTQSVNAARLSNCSSRLDWNGS